MKTNKVKQLHEYFILNNYMYEVKHGNCKQIISKQSISESLNITDLLEKVLPYPFLAQLQEYQNDNFVITGIDKDYSVLKITLESQTSKAIIQGVYESIYDIIPTALIAKILARQNYKIDKEYSLLSTDIEKIKTALKYASKDKNREVLNSIYICNNQIISTSGVCLYSDFLSFSVENELILSSFDLENFFKSNKDCLEVTLKICGDFAIMNENEIDIIDRKYPGTDQILNKNYNIPLLIQSSYKKQIKSKDKNPIVTITKNKIICGDLSFEIKTNYEYDFKIDLALEFYNHLVENDFNIMLNPENKFIKSNNIIIMPLNTSYFNPVHQIALIQADIDNFIKDINYSQDAAGRANNEIKSCNAGIERLNDLLNGKEITQEFFKELLRLEKIKLPISIYKKLPQSIKLNENVTAKFTENELNKFEYALKTIKNKTEKNISVYKSRIFDGEKNISKASQEIKEFENKIIPLENKIFELSKIEVKQAAAVEPVQEIKTENCSENLTPKFCLKQFAIYYLIANFEQQKEITLDQIKNLFYSIAKLQSEYEINTEKQYEKMKTDNDLRQNNIQNDYFNGKDISISDFIFLCYKVRTSFTFDFQSNLKKKLDFINNGKQLKNCKLSKELQVLKDKLNNLNLEQSKELIKPLQTKLPALITIQPKQEPKTVLKQVLSIEYKPVLSLPSPKTNSIQINNNIAKVLPNFNTIEQIEVADYTEVTQESDLEVCSDFYEKYYVKLHEKRSLRKANSKITAVFNKLMQMSVAACLCFIFVNAYFNISKHENTFQNLANLENKTELNQDVAKEAAKTMLDLSDNRASDTKCYVEDKTTKNDMPKGLELISFIAFGITRRKAKKEFKKNVSSYLNRYAAEILGSCKNRSYADLYIANPTKSLKRLKLFIQGYSKEAIKSRLNA